MDLILWRHADAEPAARGQSDMDRALTAKGRRQASIMARWLEKNLPRQCRILASPAVRTAQTAAALGRPYESHAGLAPDVPAQSILAAAGWPGGNGTVVVVGHQPTLGRTLALLIAGAEQDWTLRKGSICWIAQKPEDETAGVYIKLLLPPDMADA